MSHRGLEQRIKIISPAIKKCEITNCNIDDQIQLTKKLKPISLQPYDVNL